MTELQDPHVALSARGAVQVRFVLVETSRAGNIGAAARAMKTMGFHDLVLVNPRDADPLNDAEAVAFASGAQDVLAQARILGSMAEALDGVQFAAAVSARLREYSPPILTPRAFGATLAAPSEQDEAAAETTEQATQPKALQVAVIFGNERFGLPNEIVESCNALVNIPANPAYSSLNLAQAVQILAYECRMALAGETPTGTGIGLRAESASVDQVDGMYTHLEQGLIAIDFLNPENPKKLMNRIKRLLSRTGLEVEEVNILRGIAKQMLAKK